MQNVIGGEGRDVGRVLGAAVVAPLGAVCPLSDLVDDGVRPPNGG